MLPIVPAHRWVTKLKLKIKKRDPRGYAHIPTAIVEYSLPTDIPTMYG